MPQFPDAGLGVKTCNGSISPSCGFAPTLVRKWAKQNRPENAMAEEQRMMNTLLASKETLFLALVKTLRDSHTTDWKRPAVVGVGNSRRV